MAVQFDRLTVIDHALQFFFSQADQHLPTRTLSQLQ